MTTFAKTWTTDGNRVPGDNSSAANQGKWILWWMKSIITNTGFGQAANAGAWSVDQSSPGDGTFNTTGTDTWTTTYNNAKLVNATTGTNHSWMVLKSPTMNGTNYYFTIDLNNATATSATFALSKTRPSGGSATTAPTATDAITFSAQQYAESALAAAHVHSDLATDGSWILMTSKDGTAKFNLLLHLNLLSQNKSGDAFPLCWHVEFVASGGVGTVTQLNVGTNTITKARDTANASTVVLVCTVFNYNSGNIMTIMGTTDSEDGKHDDAPILMFSTTTLHLSQKGFLQDIWWAPTSDAVGTTEPATGTTQRTICGNLWVPWIGVTSGGNPAAPSL